MANSFCKSLIVNQVAKTPYTVCTQQKFHCKKCGPQSTSTDKMTGIEFGICIVDFEEHSKLRLRSIPISINKLQNHKRLHSKRVDLIN